MKRYFRIFLVPLLFTISKAFKPNILLFVIDDLRPALGIYNDLNAYTPNIDKLSQESVVFQNAFAQQALCAPSRNSFLTSRRPDTLHLYDFYSYWRDEVGNFTTLPQYFKENGYVTHSIGKVFHPGISSNYTDDYPLSWTYEPFHPETQKYKNAKVCMGDKGIMGRNIVCPVRVRDQPGHTLPDIECLKSAQSFLIKQMQRQKLNTEDEVKPYFLSVGFQKPHIPLKFPREFIKYHPLDTIIEPINPHRPPLMPMVAWNPWTDFRERDDIKKLSIDFPFGEMPRNYTKLILQSYAASVTYVDDLIGQLLNFVDLSNTIVVLLGDHGVSMGEHGEFSKFSNFDVATRVPFIIRIPHLTKRSLVSDRVIELLDLFPTLVDLAELQPIKKCPHKIRRNSKNGLKRNEAPKLCTEGKSLVPHITSLSSNMPKTKCYDCVAISQYPRPNEFPSEKPNSDKPRLKNIQIMGYSIRTDDIRYTEWIQFDHHTFEANWTNVYARELYMHKIDAQENLNLAGQTRMAGIVRHMHQLLLTKLNVV